MRTKALKTFFLYIYKKRGFPIVSGRISQQKNAKGQP